MLQRVFLFLLLSIILTFPALAQQKPFDGYWTGYLTQEKGGFRPKYYFELRLEQQGNKVTGVSYASVDKIYVEMALEGEIQGDVLKFKETKMVRYTRLEEMAWCFKWGNLRLNRKNSAWRLEGGWEGNSSFGPCIPGKVFLVKTVPKV